MRRDDVHKSTSGQASPSPSLVGTFGESSHSLSRTESASAAQAPLSELWRQIEQRMGICPSFFRLADDDPAIAHGLFDLTRLAYLDSPMPALFKEKLFTYLSKFCPVRYCIARHSAFLLGRGYVAGDSTVPPMTPREVAGLLEEPLPDHDDLPQVLAELNRETAPLSDWPDFDSRLGKLCRTACAMVFLNPGPSHAWSHALHRLLGPRQYEQLMLFLAFVRMAHFWTEVHGELRLEADVEQLIREHELLARPLLESTGDTAQTVLEKQLHAELLELREERTMADALRASREQLQLISDAVPALIAYLDANQRHVWVNRPYAHQFAYRVDEIVGEPVSTVLGMQNYKLVREYLKSALAGAEQEYEFELLVPGADERRVKYATNIPHWDASGNVVGCFVLVVDITERKQVEEELKSLNRTLEERVAERTERLTRQRQQLRRLAHQLTTAEERERKQLAYSIHEGLQQLLVAAKTQLELVRNGDATREIDKLDALLGQVLDESRSLTYSLTPPLLYDADLPHALRWLVRWLDDHNQFTVHLECSSDFPQLGENERFFLYGIVRELLLNAIKHSGACEAHVKLRREADFAVIEVWDEGQGFDPEKLDADQELTAFGLFSIRERLSALGGTLQIDSAEGRGATFRVNLPISGKGVPDATRDELDTSSRPEADPIGDPLKVVRVLLADDHDIVREGYSMILQAKSGIVVVGEAANGRDAVELAGQLLPDIIVMDISMPEMDGIEATKQITEQHPQIKIIGLSMHQSQDMADEMCSAGASTYLSKDDAARKLYNTILEVSGSTSP